MIINVLKCEATGKSRYPTPGDAKKAIATIARRNRGKNRSKKITGKGGVKRSYHCAYCNGYHLTSADYKNIREQRKEMQLKRQKAVGLVITDEEALNWKKDSLPFPKI